MDNIRRREPVYSPLAVANRFIELAVRNNTTVDPLKLQKLVYLAHGWHHALAGRPLIDEPIQAWQHGPVVPSVYHQFKEYRFHGISKPAAVLRPEPGSAFKFKHFVPRVPEGDAAAVHTINEVWRVYSGFSGTQLSNLTHQPGSPWDRTRRATNARNAVIDEGTIRDHFRGLLAQGSG